MNQPERSIFYINGDPYLDVCYGPVGYTRRLKWWEDILHHFFGRIPNE